MLPKKVASVLQKQLTKVFEHEYMVTNYGFYCWLSENCMQVKKLVSKTYLK